MEIRRCRDSVAQLNIQGHINTWMPQCKSEMNLDERLKVDGVPLNLHLITAILEKIYIIRLVLYVIIFLGSSPVCEEVHS